MKRTIRVVGRVALALVLAALVGPSSAFAAGFVRLPHLAGNNQHSLRIRFVRYTGGANGRMIVDVKNVSKRAVQFEPRGLYFVPDGSPEKAPQRLGAAGPLKVDKQGHWVDANKLTLRGGQTARVSLQVFCLDSHRSAPAASQTFSLASKRLPKTLRREITRGVADAYKGVAAEALPAVKMRAKSRAQSTVWKTRNKKWIKLQGERKNEK